MSFGFEILDGFKLRKIVSHFLDARSARKYRSFRLVSCSASSSALDAQYLQLQQGARVFAHKMLGRTVPHATP